MDFSIPLTDILLIRIEKLGIGHLVFNDHCWRNDSSYSSLKPVGASMIQFKLILSVIAQGSLAIR